MLKTAIPPLTNDAEFFPGMPKNWGLSFMINEQTAPTGRSAGSLAWAGLANTYYWIDQRKGVAGVYMSRYCLADEKALPLFYAFEKSVYSRWLRSAAASIARAPLRRPFFCRRQVPCADRVTPRGPVRLAARRGLWPNRVCLPTPQPFRDHGRALEPGTASVASSSRISAR